MVNINSTDSDQAGCSNWVDRRQSGRSRSRSPLRGSRVPLLQYLKLYLLLQQFGFLFLMVNINSTDSDQAGCSNWVDRRQSGRSHSRSQSRGSRRTPSPVLAPPIAAQLENVVVAGPPGIFAGNPVLSENCLRCQYYERTGCSLRNPCPFTHGYVFPS
jgi:hypothetical protein